MVVAVIPERHPQWLMSASPSAELKVRADFARKVVQRHIRYFSEHLGQVKHRLKADGSVVSKIDLAISRSMTRAIRGRFAADGVISEEVVTAADTALDGYCWVLDPIDGTNNYVLGVAHCAISLGLLWRGSPVYGVIYDHSRGVLMEGGPGFGLRESGRRIKPQHGFAEKLNLVGFHRPVDKNFRREAAAMMRDFKLRVTGSSALHLAYVARGFLAGSVDHNVKVWDIAAGAALCAATRVSLKFRSGPLFPLTDYRSVPRKAPYYAAAGPRMERRLARTLKWTNKTR